MDRSALTMLLDIPSHIIYSNVLPHLSVGDFRSLDSALTNKSQRPHLRNLWKSYSYERLHEEKLAWHDVQWLLDCGVDIVALSLRCDCMNALSLLTSHVPSLKQLTLYVDFFTDDECLQLVHGCPELESLRLFGLYTLSDASVIPLAQQYSKLHTLYLSNCDISDAAIEALCAHCPNMVHLSLVSCRQLTDVSLRAIAQAYPHLQAIDITDHTFTDPAIMHFAMKCRELKAAAVGGDNIAGNGLGTLCISNQNLVDLDLSHTRFTDGHLVPLLKFWKKLQRINLSNCRGITDASVIAVAEQCPRLSSFNIDSCCNITDASLLALAQHAHVLKSIVLASVHKITDEGIAALAAGCPLLQEFSAGYTRLSDVAITRLVSHCRHLIKIDLSGCELIGAATASAIAKYCPLISEVILKDCMMDADALLELKQCCHNLVSVVA